MLFSSVIFIVVFLPLVLFFYYVAFRKSRKLQNAFLLIASLGFYAWGEPWFVLIMMLSIVGNYFFGLLVDKHRNVRNKCRAIISLMLIFNLTIIFIFKYLMFTIDNINNLMGLNIEIGDISLPIGISFFTFQAISYVIDIYREKGEVQKNLLNVGLYISFFPQLIAGPIVRYETVSHQIMYRRESFDDFSTGICRFIIGMSKKVLLANNFAIIADKAFANVDAGISSVTFAWMGAIAYTLQIYFDFSGYSDMAIGLGKMFGFHFPENFRYPYISKSISEFWRRWHISLGTWFRDYVYFPLGGSRVSTKKRLIFNLFVVWALTGLWHGANWTFIVWGLLYFLLISVEKLTAFEEKLRKSGKIFRGFAHIYTMLLVILGWVLFRADDIGCAMDYVSVLFGGCNAPLTDKFAIAFWQENKFYFFFGILFSMPVATKISEILNKLEGTAKKAVTVIYPIVMLAAFIFAMSYLIKGAYNPFIYFNF